MGIEILNIYGEKLTEGKIAVDIYSDAEDAFKVMADMMVEEIVANNAQGKPTLMINPVGPIGQYKYFVKRINEERISLKNVTFINMDEYMEDIENLVSEDHPLSFKGFMNQNCYNLIDKDLVMPISQRYFPAEDNADEISDVIAQHNGVDICFGGIGVNGHVAFNEPPEEGDNMSIEEFKNLSVRKQKISRETRVVNSLNEYDGAFYFMPEYCVTIGFKEILSSKKIRLFCFRNWHKSVVKRAIFGEETIKFPVTFLQSHPDARIAISDELSK